MLKEFKEFIMRGNVMDLAIGVIIGAAFGKIVTSVVDDLIMPPIGKLLGNVDFTNLYLPLSGQTAATLEEAKKAGPVIAYGNFINTVVQFLIVALVIFLVVKAVNRLMRKKAAADEAPAPTKTEILLEEIRDLMRRQV